jgi:hypothetical protein
MGSFTDQADGNVYAGWDGGEINAQGAGSVLISITGISGGDSYAIKGSITGANPKTLAVANLGATDGVLVTSITADGLYLVPAAGRITFVKTGSASTPTVNAMVKR